MNSEKYSNKEFSLSQYYNQLEKYESTLGSTKKPSLKKDYSLTTFSKDQQKTSVFSKTSKEPFRQEKPKLGITDKYASKTSFEKFSKVKPESMKKLGSLNDHFKVNSYVVDSLASSNIVSKKWQNESCLEEKENIPFGPQDEEKFLEHCTQLYGIGNSDSLVNDIAVQINKRDQVYQVVTQHFSSQSQQTLPEKIQEYFSEHELMARIIEQFKGISHLQMADLNELYYFLKSDR